MLQLLRALRPRKLPLRHRVSRAAVALIYRRSEAGEMQLLFIQRALRHGDPWSGHMAFPGGRLEQQDTSSEHTATRETLEETGLDLTRHGRHQARLSDLLTRQHNRWRPMVVTPHVFEWAGPETLAFNHEVQQRVWVPLSHLSDPANQSTLRWSTRFGHLKMPCVRYQGHCIWGLSYSMLQEFLVEFSASGQ
ncbi:MAG: CoA pyrophosphatase [Halomonadaceae bacterium]|nr:MAG: CoA pyrophosphatase [Halomonadaceae bacterium]